MRLPAVIAAAALAFAACAEIYSPRIGVFIELPKGAPTNLAPAQIAYGLDPAAPSNPGYSRRVSAHAHAQAYSIIDAAIERSLLVLGKQQQSFYMPPPGAAILTNAEGRVMFDFRQGANLFSAYDACTAHVASVAHALDIPQPLISPLFPEPFMIDVFTNDHDRTLTSFHDRAVPDTMRWTRPLALQVAGVLDAIRARGVPEDSILAKFGPASIAPAPLDRFFPAQWTPLDEASARTNDFAALPAIWPQFCSLAPDPWIFDVTNSWHYAQAFLFVPKFFYLSDAEESAMSAKENWLRQEYCLPCSITNILCDRLGFAEAIAATPRVFTNHSARLDWRAAGIANLLLSECRWQYLNSTDTDTALLPSFSNNLASVTTTLAQRPTGGVITIDMLGPDYCEGTVVVSNWLTSSESSSQTNSYFYSNRIISCSSAPILAARGQIASDLVFVPFPDAETVAAALGYPTGAFVTPVSVSFAPPYVTFVDLGGPNTYSYQAFALPLSLPVGTASTRVLVKSSSHARTLGLDYDLSEYGFSDSDLLDDWVEVYSLDFADERFTSYDFPDFSHSASPYLPDPKHASNPLREFRATSVTNIHNSAALRSAILSHLSSLITDAIAKSEAASGESQAARAAINADDLAFLSTVSMTNSLGVTGQLEIDPGSSLSLIRSTPGAQTVWMIDGLPISQSTPLCSFAATSVGEGTPDSSDAAIANHPQASCQSFFQFAIRALMSWRNLRFAP